MTIIIRRMYIKSNDNSNGEDNDNNDNASKPEILYDLTRFFPGLWR